MLLRVDVVTRHQSLTAIPLGADKNQVTINNNEPISSN